MKKDREPPWPDGGKEKRHKRMMGILYYYSKNGEPNIIIC